MRFPLLLGLSLLINLALVSFVATQTIAQAPAPQGSNPKGLPPDDAAGTPPQVSREQGPRLPRELRSLAHLDVLTAEQRQTVRSVINQHLPAIKAQGETARAASRNFREALDSPGFDPADVKEKSALMVAARADHHRLATAALVDALAALPPDAQAALAENRRERRTRREDRRRRLRSQREK
ncbi:MAG: periplasmic heavy metal sensor [Pseudomonadota bacterium]